MADPTDPTNLPEYVLAAKHPAWKRVVLIAQVLLKTDAPWVTSVLGELVDKETDPDVLAATLKTAARRKEFALAPRILRRLDHPSSRVLTFAIAALVVLDPAGARTSARQMAASLNPRRRSAGLFGMLKLDRDEALELVRATLGEADPTLRRSAIIALSKARAEGVASLVLQHFLREDTKSLVVASGLLLRQCVPPPPPEEVRAAVTQLTFDPSTLAVRKLAFLARMGMRSRSGKLRKSGSTKVGRLAIEQMLATGPIEVGQDPAALLAMAKKSAGTRATPAGASAKVTAPPPAAGFVATHASVPTGAPPARPAQGSSAEQVTQAAKATQAAKGATTVRIATGSPPPAVPGVLTGAGAGVAPRAAAAPVSAATPAAASSPAGPSAAGAPPAVTTATAAPPGAGAQGVPTVVTGMKVMPGDAGVPAGTPTLPVTMAGQVLPDAAAVSGRTRAMFVPAPSQLPAISVVMLILLAVAAAGGMLAILSAEPDPKMPVGPVSAPVHALGKEGDRFSVPCDVLSVDTEQSLLVSRTVDGTVISAIVSDVKQLASVKPGQHIELRAIIRRIENPQLLVVEAKGFKQAAR